MRTTNEKYIVERDLVKKKQLKYNYIKITFGLIFNIRLII